MEGLSEKVLFWIFISVFSLILIGAIAVSVNSAKKNAQQVNGQMDEAVQSALEAEFTDYEGTSPSGSTVINLIKNWSNKQICAKVVTKKTTTTYIYADTDFTTKSTATIADALDKSKASFINPTANFACTLTRDSNNVIVEVIFTQK